ncbi:MAG: hypothetical protein EBS19_00970 [Spirochaetia bacterium]|nr:hypothetical protein [Spirochaetia bacterium]
MENQENISHLIQILRRMKTSEIGWILRDMSDDFQFEPKILNYLCKELFTPPILTSELNEMDLEIFLKSLPQSIVKFLYNKYSEFRSPIKNIYDSKKLKSISDKNISEEESNQLIIQEILKLYENKEYFNIKFGKKLKIISVVRNPYERIMSELFYRGTVKPGDSPDKVYEMLRWLVSTNIDNHTTPQHTYIDGPLIILHTETLEKDMHDLGFTDFHVVANQNEYNVNYYDYLNVNSIEFINRYYRVDFERFGYTML